MKPPTTFKRFPATAIADTYAVMEASDCRVDKIRVHPSLLTLKGVKDLIYPWSGSKKFDWELWGAAILTSPRLPQDRIEVYSDSMPVYKVVAQMLDQEKLEGCRCVVLSNTIPPKLYKKCGVKDPKDNYPVKGKKSK